MAIPRIPANQTSPQSAPLRSGRNCAFSLHSYASNTSTRRTLKQWMRQCFFPPFLYLIQLDKALSPRKVNTVPIPNNAASQTDRRSPPLGSDWSSSPFSSFLHHKHLDKAHPKTVDETTCITIIPVPHSGNENAQWGQWL